MTQSESMTNTGRTSPRVGFVTIGHSPRDDIVPAMLAWIGTPIEAVQTGALDGLTNAQIEALAPVGEEPRLVSRLRDGSEVVASRAQMHSRVLTLLDQADKQGLDAIVLLCTGQFPKTQLQTPLVSAQAAVDLGALALARDAGSIGLMVPNPAQAQAAQADGWNGLPVKTAWSSPYGQSRFPEAARELADTDLIVMHCMGYDGAMLEQVRELSGRPALLAQRLVASALRQLL